MRCIENTLGRNWALRPNRTPVSCQYEAEHSETRMRAILSTHQLKYNHVTITADITYIMTPQNVLFTWVNLLKFVTVFKYSF